MSGWRSIPQFGPLAVAMALATGIAIAPALDSVGIAPWLHWLATALIAAVAVGLAASLRRRRAHPQHATDAHPHDATDAHPHDAPDAVPHPAARTVRRRGVARLVVLAVAFALGAARGAQPTIELPAGAIPDDRLVDRVVGVVHGPIIHGPRGDGALLEPDESGTAIWLFTEERLVPGERIAATGLLRTPRGLLDPAVPDRQDATRARGAELELTARSIDRRDNAGGLRDAAWRWAGATQARWARSIDQAGGDPIGTAALRGIAVGDRGDVPPALDQRWRAVGIYHVLSVSGLHLAVVAGLVFGLLRRLIAASPWGGRTRPARWAAPPALVLAVAYTMITGAQLATLRALVVVALALIAQMIDRPLRLLDALGVAALAILLWRPADLLDPSFQLSFVAALTLALRPLTDDGRRGIRGWLVRGLSASAWVAITTAPLTAYHFHQVAAGGVIGNLLLTPVVELVALPLGLAGVVLGVAPAITAASWIVGLADRGAEALALITPVGHIAVASASIMLLLVALSLAIAARTVERTHPFERSRAALAWLALCLVWAVARMPPPAGALRVTFLDVGQGDAALIELPDGAVWLIDAGGQPSARELSQAAASGRAIDRVLAAYDHTRIDLAILSHPHPDHYLGLAGIEAPIDELWSGTETTSTDAAASAAAVVGHAAGEARLRTRGSVLPGFGAVAAGLIARGTRLGHPALGVARSQAGVELVVWAPRMQAAADAPVVCAADPVRTVNDNSLVVALRYRGRTILFTGDIETEGEDDLVAAGIGRVDVVKVPHHGSPTSSTAALIAATRPALAVISCGRANAFGFPAASVVDRWRAAGASVGRTDTDGAITVTIDVRGEIAIERFGS
ncbi:MAG TPA: ComEC/Rec2 family competence protein [Kofleriaceae bacterium]|nr:ComEC/Rec2 family competence protein [Kofleriaceae bacterium]